MFFFWYKPEEKSHIISELRKMGRSDLIDKLYPKSATSFSSRQYPYQPHTQQGSSRTDRTVSQQPNRNKKSTQNKQTKTYKQEGQQYQQSSRNKIKNHNSSQNKNSRSNKRYRD